ncbi:hypothetical protein J6590_062561 [Homalodisca vitripennis]|nr:hypothetical protein J6590_062561 [Homalodisca vitripennis]
MPYMSQHPSDGPTAVSLCWLLSTISLVFTLWFLTLFIRPSYEDSPWLLAINAGLVQKLWVFGAAWIVVACTFGYGGWLGKWLSWPGFIPLARLSFGMYLIHVTLQGVQVLRSRQSNNMDAFDIRIMLPPVNHHTLKVTRTVKVIEVDEPRLTCVWHIVPLLHRGLSGPYTSRAWHAV